MPEDTTQDQGQQALNDPPAVQQTKEENVTNPEQLDQEKLTNPSDVGSAPADGETPPFDPHATIGPSRGFNLFSLLQKLFLFVVQQVLFVIDLFVNNGKVVTEPLENRFQHTTQVKFTANSPCLYRIYHDGENISYKQLPRTGNSWSVTVTWDGSTCHFQKARQSQNVDLNFSVEH